MFGNEMLVTSWLFCCLMTAVIIFHLLDPLLVKFKSEFKFEIPSIIPVIVKPVLLLAGTFAFKVIVGKILNIRDDVSIWVQRLPFYFYYMCYYSIKIIMRWTLVCTYLLLIQKFRHTLGQYCGPNSHPTKISTRYFTLVPRSLTSSDGKCHWKQLWHFWFPPVCWQWC